MIAKQQSSLVKPHERAFLLPFSAISLASVMLSFAPMNTTICRKVIAPKGQL
jgi:hypothetical protein